MAGGPNAAVIPCIKCAGKANRLSEGLETDLYECEACQLRFLIDWSRDGPPEKPRLPLTTPNDDMRSPVWHALIAAFCFTAVGTLCAYLITSDAIGEGWAALPIYTGVATFLVAFGVWWLHLKWVGPLGISRGALVGAGIGLLAHPVTWCFFGIATWLSDVLGAPTLQGEASVNLADVLWGVMVFSFWSLFLLGLVTISLAAFVGATIARWQEYGVDDRRHIDDRGSAGRRPRGTASVAGWNKRGCRAYDFNCPLAAPALRDRLNQTGPWAWQRKRFSFVAPHLLATPDKGSKVSIFYPALGSEFSAILHIKSESARDEVDDIFRRLLTKAGVSELRPVKPEDCARFKGMRDITGG